MAKKQIDAMLDAALDYISTNGTELYICTSEPADRAAADTASVVPVQTPSYSANADGDSSGRKKTVQAINDITLDASGTVTHIAICSGTTLLYVTTTTSQAVSSGGTVSMPAWDIEIADVT